MSFRLSGLPASANSYTAALNLYATRDPWPGETDEGDERPLAKLGGSEKRQRIHGVRTTPDGDVIFRYHDTDVVTWHGPTEVTLRLYPSVSTCTFIDAFTPGVVSASYARKSENMALCVRQMWGTFKYPTGAYETVRLVYVEGRWYPVYKTHYQFVKDRVNRKRATEIRAGTNYAAYRDYYNMMAAMGFEVSHADQRDANITLQTDPCGLTELMEDEAKFPVMYQAGYTPQGILKTLYNAEGDVYYTEHFRIHKTNGRTIPTSPTIEHTDEVHHYNIGDDQ